MSNGMSKDRSPDDLSTDEQALFERLPLERAAPEHLEPRVADGLVREGLLARGPQEGVGTRRARASGRGAWVRPLLAAVAAGVLFAAGSWYGRQAVPPVELGRASYALLLYDGPEFEAYTTENYPGRFDAYSRWIADLRAEGRFVGGEALDETARVLRPGEGEPLIEERMPAAPDGSISGVLFIDAESYEDATRIAATIPHVQYGGRVVVRRVQPT